MDKSKIQQTLSTYRKELKDLRIVSLSLFGSVARGESTEGSDIDLLVEFDRRVGLFHFVKVKEFLENILGVEHVDLVTRDALIEDLRDDILKEMIRVA